jgi:hypothetical protein
LLGIRSFSNPNPEVAMRIILFTLAVLLSLSLPHQGSAQVSPPEPSGSGLMYPAPITDDAQAVSTPTMVSTTWLGLQATKLFFARFGIPLPVTARDLGYLSAPVRQRVFARRAR